MKVKMTPDEYWRQVLTGTHPMMRLGRNFFKKIPSEPRCKLCYSPFNGFGGSLMKILGKGPWGRNPSICQMCFTELAKMGVGGVELEVTLLFADIRGSTALAESMSPTDYSAVVNRFFRCATKVIVNNDGIIDQLVGDEVVALFLPAFCGDDHARRAIETATMLVESMARPDGNTIPIPIGVGVHTGIAYVGSVGSADSFTDFTVLGDPVNTAGRLASAAAAGEILISDAAAAHAGFDTTTAERRELTLKGKSETMSVSVIRCEAESFASA
jgi:adenylate cyclase